MSSPSLRTRPAPRPIVARIASADLKKKNGQGTVAALNNARAAAAAAEAAAEEALKNRSNNHSELEAYAKKKRKAVQSVHSAGYDLAAAAAGDTFYPAGFTEFAGWATSAKAILRAITHKGDALAADEEGDRFDAGTEGTWATLRPGSRRAIRAPQTFFSRAFSSEGSCRVGGGGPRGSRQSGAS